MCLVCASAVSASSIGERNKLRTKNANFTATTSEIGVEKAKKMNSAFVKWQRIRMVTTTLAMMSIIIIERSWPIGMKCVSKTLDIF